MVEQLLSNAVKYMQEGVITIQTGQNETEAFLCMEDQGIGIRQEDIPRVLNRGTRDLTDIRINIPPGSDCICVSRC